MIPVPSGVRVWLATGTTDMRLGMPGLALRVQEALGRNPHAGDLYVFRGRRGDLIKVLWPTGWACRSTPNGWNAAGSSAQTDHVREVAAFLQTQSAEGVVPHGRDPQGRSIRILRRIPEWNWPAGYVCQ